MKAIQLNMALCLFLTYSITAQTSIKMEKNGSSYLIPCKVNGLNLKFIFDTGADDVSISMTEALFMLKNGYLKQEDIGGSNYYSTASGDLEEGTKIILRTLEIGGVELHDVSASVISSFNAPLLLGQSVLQRFGKFSFDYSNNTLILGSGNYVSEKQAPNDQSNQSASRNSFSIASGYMVTHASTSLKDSPSNAAKTIMTIPEGEEVQITGKQWNCYQIIYRNKKGWVDFLALDSY